MKRSLVKLLLVLMWGISLNLHISYAEDSKKSTITTPTSEAIKTEALLKKVRQLREEQPELFSKAKGVLVVKIVPDSQGEKVGLQPGDILLTYSGIPLESTEQLIELSGNKPKSSPVKLTYLRKTSQHTVSIQGRRIGVHIQSLVPSQSELTEQMNLLMNQGIKSYNKGNFQSAKQFFEEGLAIAEEANNKGLRADFLNNLGVVSYRLSDYPKALVYYQQYLAFQRELKNRTGEAVSLNNLGNVYQSLSDYPKALDYLQQSLAINRELKNRAGEVGNLNNLGNVYQSLSDYPKALDYLQQSLAIQRELKNRAGEADSLNNLGNVYQSLSDYPKALDYHKQSLAIVRELKNRTGEARSLNNLGAVYERLSDYPKALDYHKQSLAIVRELKNRTGEARSLNNLGAVYERLSDYPKALDYHKQSLAIQRELKNRTGEARSLNNLGAVYERLSDYPKALDYHQQSLAIQRELKNRAGEVSNLNNLGNVYQSLSDYPKALDYYQQSLAINRELKNHVDEANSLSNLGAVYKSLSDYPKALDYHQQSLAIQRKLKNRTGEASSLNNLGNVYDSLSNYPKALDCYRQSLAIQRELKNRTGEAVSFNNLGNVHRSLSDYPKALDYHQQSLAIQRELKNHAGEADNLNNLGNVYQRLSNYPKALDYYQQSLAIQRELKNRTGQARSLNNLGTVYDSLSDYPKALDYLQQSLAIERQLKNRAGEADSLNNLGNVYQRLSNYPKALDYYQLSLVIKRELKNRAGEASSLNNLGNLYQSLSDYPKALDYYQQSLAILTQTRNPDFHWMTWEGLYSSYLKLKQPAPAIFAGKQAVNVLQRIRASNTKLEEGLQKNFLDDKKYVYRNLSETLIEQGRLPEAEQVMAMLKEEEYFDFIQRESEEDARSTKASYTAKEQTMSTELDKFHTQLASLGKEYETLSKTSQIDEFAKTRLGEVEALLDKAQAEFLDLLSSLDDHFKKAGANKALAHGERQLELLESQQESLAKINAVIITTVVTEDKLHLLLTTPKVQLARQSPIGEKELNSLIKLFREALKDPRKDPNRLAQELYKHLVKPLEDDLKQTQATTLMWSLDGSLRYLPLAALHDGNQYLLERYALSLYTAAAHNDFNENSVDAWSVAGLGVSKEHPGFVALPSVPKELESIVRTDNNDKDGVIPGEIRLDKDFTRDSFKATLRKKYPVLHIASHFKLQPGDGSASKLLLGDGDTLTLDEFRRKAAFKLHGVDLITLSACDTAVGEKTEGGEVESFAVMAQLRGAKGVMATLWKVEDESTGLLMQELYKLLSQNTQLSKAEALRQAQLKLLRKEIDSKTEFNHPYFWAPFIMMGNWL